MMEKTPKPYGWYRPKDGLYLEVDYRKTDHERAIEPYLPENIERLMLPWENEKDTALRLGWVDIDFGYAGGPHAFGMVTAGNRDDAGRAVAWLRRLGIDLRLDERARVYVITLTPDGFQDRHGYGFVDGRFTLLTHDRIDQATDRRGVPGGLDDIRDRVEGTRAFVAAEARGTPFVDNAARLLGWYDTAVGSFVPAASADRMEEVLLPRLPANRDELRLPWESVGDLAVRLGWVAVRFGDGVAAGGSLTAAGLREAEWAMDWLWLRRVDLALAGRHRIVTVAVDEDGHRERAVHTLEGGRRTDGPVWRDAPAAAFGCDRDWVRQRLAVQPAAAARTGVEVQEEVRGFGR